MQIGSNTYSLEIRCRLQNVVGGDHVSWSKVCFCGVVQSQYWPWLILLASWFGYKIFVKSILTLCLLWDSCDNNVTIHLMTVRSSVRENYLDLRCVLLINYQIFYKIHWELAASVYLWQTGVVLYSSLIVWGGC